MRGDGSRWFAEAPVSWVRVPGSTGNSSRSDRTSGSREAADCGALEVSVPRRFAGGSTPAPTPDSAQLTKEGVMSAMSQETGNITGTQDKDYNLIWFTEQCLSNAMRLDIYIQDAERAGDGELAEFFRKAQADSRKGAEQGKTMLRSRLGG
jgi:hypothetical protein